MWRSILLISLLFTASPALAEGDGFAHQLLGNIIEGSPATPGGVSLINAAQDGFAALDAQLQNAATGTSAERRAALAEASKLITGSNSDIGLFRIMAHINANASFALEAPNPPPGFSQPAMFVRVSSDNLISWLDEIQRLADSADQVQGAELEDLVTRLQTLLRHCQDGVDLDNDGMVLASQREGGMKQIRQALASLAAQFGFAWP